jgi:hypothetical protein
MAPGHVIERDDFDRLFEALSTRGHTIIGPTVRDQAIVYDEIRSTEDLPIGWADEQDGGRYRLRRRDDQALFGYAVGPHSWKKYQLPPELKLWEARVDTSGALVEFAEPPREPTGYAFLGAGRAPPVDPDSPRQPLRDPRRAPRRAHPPTVLRDLLAEQTSGSLERHPPNALHAFSEPTVRRRRYAPQ